MADGAGRPYQLMPSSDSEELSPDSMTSCPAADPLCLGSWHSATASFSISSMSRYFWNADELRTRKVHHGPCACLARVQGDTSTLRPLASPLGCGPCSSYPSCGHVGNLAYGRLPSWVSRSPTRRFSCALWPSVGAACQRAAHQGFCTWQREKRAQPQ